MIEVKSLMGFLGFDRKFVGISPRYHTWLHNFKEREENFYGLKNINYLFNTWRKKLTATPILRVPDPQKNFFVIINAPREGVGGVIMQDE